MLFRSSYEDALSDRYGFETARVAWTPTAQEIEEWARYDHLLRPMVAYSPDARQIWRGVLAEIEIGIGTKKIAFSLKDMANRLVVRYSEPGGAQGDSVAYSNTASQALFGIKDRVINASVALSAAASNQAQTILNAIAFPRSKQASSGGTTRGELSIALTFWGKYALLDWLLTASISTASTAAPPAISRAVTASAINATHVRAVNPPTIAASNTGNFSIFFSLVLSGPLLLAVKAVYHNLLSCKEFFYVPVKIFSGLSFSYYLLVSVVMR